MRISSSLVAVAAIAGDVLAADTCALSDPILTTSTFVSGNYTDNACNRLPLLPGVFNVALSPSTGWQPHGKSCGTCVRVTSKETNHSLGNSIDAQVVDTATGLNMGMDAYTKLFGGLGGAGHVSYVQIPCAKIEAGTNSGNLRYRFKFGSRSPDYPKIYYLGVSVNNHLYPIKSVQLRNVGATAWTDCTFDMANDFCAGHGVTQVPFEIKITGHSYTEDKVVTDTITSIPDCADENSCSDTFTNSAKQLPAVSPIDCRPADQPTPPPAPTPKPAPTPPPTPGPITACTNCYTGSPCNHSECCQDDTAGVCYNPQPSTAGSLPNQPDAFACPTGINGYKGKCFCSSHTAACYNPSPPPPAPTPTPPPAPPSSNECQPAKTCNVCAACCQTYIQDGAGCDACVKAQCPGL
jgi:hypothetical protein